MPGGDRTGPMGAGPMTGRGAGFCAGFNAPGFVNARGGMGMGRGRGFGAGRGMRRAWNWINPFAAPVVPQTPGYAPVQGAAVQETTEIDQLKLQAESLTRSLEAIASRIEALEKQGAAGDGK